MHLKTLLDVALSFFEALDTPRSLTCAILAREGHWDDLVALSAPDLPVLWCGSSPDVYARSLAATDFLRKTPGLPTTADLEAAAVRSAIESEQQCASSNARLRRVLFEEGLIEQSDLPVQDFFARVRSRVHRTLGVAPCVFSLRIGAGASVSDPSARCTVPDKISNPRTSMTRHFPRECYLDWMQTKWYDARLALDSANRPATPEVVRGNVFFTVPKDSSKHRGAAKEPVLNGAYQLAIGRLMRRKLKNVGIDLELGQSVHRQLALDASVSGKLATIDLSSASDTLCSALVEYLLPDDWWKLLDGLRSKTTIGPWAGDGTGRDKARVLHLQKFSSMGNGFTFELETLIFWAISSEATYRQGFDNQPGVDVSVYGDDIIVPTDAAEGVLAALAWAGFLPNKRKTFTFGWFRESCGGDFLGGRSVRSYFVKEVPCEPQHWIGLANGIRRLATQNGGLFDCNSRFWRPWLRCLDALPSPIRRLRGPVHLGDIVIHDDSWESLARFNPDGWRYLFAYMPIRRVDNWENWPAEAVLASALYLQEHRQPVSWSRHVGPYRDDYTWFKHLDDVSHSEGVIPRDSVTGFRIKRVYAG